VEFVRPAADVSTPTVAPTTAAPAPVDSTQAPAPVVATSAPEVTVPKVVEPAPVVAPAPSPTATRQYPSYRSDANGGHYYRNGVEIAAPTNSPTN
jgi:hypothetical protein